MSQSDLDPARIGGVALDPVASRLCEEDERSPSAIEWLENQQHRIEMRRRAVWCTAGGWILVIIAAMISTAVAVHLASDLRELLAGELEDFEAAEPQSIYYLPRLLIGITGALIVGGATAWAVDKLPGFSKTVAAIDWSAASDAVTRLLTVGCTYPEAFRTAAQVSRNRQSRSWLIESANRVEKGGPHVSPTPHSGSDAAVLELLIESTDSEPQRQWKIAADHFLVLARQRLVLLMQSTPVIATIVSGLLIWIAISATLGWMWRAVVSILGGLT